MAGLFLALNFTYGSEPGNASIQVFRGDNQKPLSDASVNMVPLTGPSKGKTITGVTNEEGIFKYSYSVPVIMQISHLGFLTITDTLYKPGDRLYHIAISAQNMQDVVVTGQYASARLDKSVYEVEVINADEIRAKGANNLREALQDELHINFEEDPVFGSSASINGISGEGVKIMIDGVPVEGRINGRLDLSQIDINNIERIEIVEGPLSVLYGTDAMGGVINIITKSFQAEKVRIAGNFYYESVGQYNVALNTGFNFKNSQLFVDAGRNFFGGYSPVDTVPRLKEWKPKEQYFADAKYVYTGNRFKLTLGANFFRELMLDRSAPQIGFLPGQEIYIGLDWQYLTYRIEPNATFTYKFKEGYQLDALFGYTYYERFTDFFEKNLENESETLAQNPNTPNDTAKLQTIVFRSTYTMPALNNRLNFQMGVDIRQEYAVENILDNGRQQEGDYAVFGSARILVINGFDIQPGIRFSYNTLFSSPLIPSLNLKYNYRDKLVARLSYGRAYRAPELEELYLYFLDSNHGILGNPSLKPEDGNCVNGSLNYIVKIDRSQQLEFSTSGFYNNIDNKIDLVYTGPTVANKESDVGYEYFNIRHYITYGGEESVTYRWGRLMLNAAILYTFYQNTDTTVSVNVQRLNSPDFTAEAGYRIPKIDVGVNVYYKYTGTKPLFSLSNGITSGTQPGFNLLDLSVTKSFWKNRIQITVGGKNLLNVKDIIGTNVGGAATAHNANPDDLSIGWGRTFFTSLILQYTK